MLDPFRTAKLELRTVWNAQSPLRKQLVESLTHTAVTRHPYGFLVIKCGSHSAAELRIHVWLDGPRIRQEPDWPPHTHPGPLLSFVVAGCVRNRFWNVVSDRLGPHRIYQVSYSGEESVLKRTNQVVRVEEGPGRQICAGESYEVPEDMFHDSDVAPGRCAVTVVWMGGHTGAGSRVIGDPEGPPEIHFRRTGVTSTDILAAKQYIEQGLAALPVPVIRP